MAGVIVKARSKSVSKSMPNISTDDVLDDSPRSDSDLIGNKEKDVFPQKDQEICNTEKTIVRLLLESITQDSTAIAKFLVTSISCVAAFVCAFIFTKQIYKAYDSEYHGYTDFGQPYILPVDTSGKLQWYEASFEILSFDGDMKEAHEIYFSIYRVPHDDGGIADEIEIFSRTEIYRPESNFNKFEFHKTLAKAGVVPSDTCYLSVSTQLPGRIGFEAHILQMGAVGQHQVLISALLLSLLYVLMMLEIFDRTLSVLACSLLSVFVLAALHKVPGMKALVQMMDEETLGLLFGMMIIVQVIGFTGVFEYLAARCVIYAKGRKVVVLIYLTTLTAVLSAFLDNVTTILLLGGPTLQIAQLLELDDPTEFLIAIILMSNIGGAATLIGDPPNLIVGNVFQGIVDFLDFPGYMLPSVLISMPVALKVIFWFNHKQYSGVVEVDTKKLQKEYPIKDPALLVDSSIILFFVLLMFCTHSIHHMKVSWIAVVGAIMSLCLIPAKWSEKVYHDLEWDTLLFFAALFIMIGALERMHLLTFIADTIIDIITAVDGEKAQTFVAMQLIMWSSAIISSLVDNIPFTTAMAQVIFKLSSNPALNVDIRAMIWSLAIGACFGGNGTIIGASANIVGASIASHHDLPISFFHFAKRGYPVMLISVALADVLLTFHFVIGFSQWFIFGIACVGSIGAAIVLLVGKKGKDALEKSEENEVNL